MTISVGIAEGPAQASAARDLLACADAALREAKAAGKDRVVVWGHDAGRIEGVRAPVGSRDGRRPLDGRGRPRPADLALGDELRSVAHLKMLQSLSQKLNRLNDVERIGETITAELRSLIDYHNCRVHLLQPDGETLLPVAFRGELLEYQGETFDALVTKMGEGITGRVAETGQPFYAPNATTCEFSVLLPGTIDIDESILCVPMAFGDRVIGTVTLSKLGIDQFDRSGPPAAGGARLARGRGVRERAPVPDRTRVRRGLGRAARAVAGADAGARRGWRSGSRRSRRSRG